MLMNLETSTESSADLEFLTRHNLPAGGEYTWPGQNYSRKTRELDGVEKSVLNMDAGRD